MSDRKLIGALRAARRCIRGTRRTVFDSHCLYDRTAGKRVVTDPSALDWLAELDEVVAKIDAALPTPKPSPQGERE